MVFNSHCRRDTVAAILSQHLMTVSVSKLKVTPLTTDGSF